MNKETEFNIARRPLSPCQDSVKMRHPAIKFGGGILYSRTAVEVEKAAGELLQSLKAKLGEMGEVALGLDIEWKPSFRKGVSPGKVAVMQLCADDNHCHVMHIIHSGITPSLQSLLEDSTVPKVGVGIGGDSTKIFREYNVLLKNMQDLSFFANQKLDGDPKGWSLGALTELLVCQELPKPRGIRLGNWEAGALSKKQLQYAATDAFASWKVYQVLNNLPTPIAAADGKEELKVVPRAAIAAADGKEELKDVPRVVRKTENPNRFPEPDRTGMV